MWWPQSSPWCYLRLAFGSVLPLSNGSTNSSRYQKIESEQFSRRWVKRFVCDATTTALLLLLTQENAFYYSFYEDIIHAEDFLKGVNLLLAHPVSV